MWAVRMEIVKGTMLGVGIKEGIKVTWLLLLLG